MLLLSAFIKKVKKRRLVIANRLTEIGNNELPLQTPAFEKISLISEMMKIDSLLTQIEIYK